MCFCGLQEAFDLVDRSSLWSGKLIGNNIKGKIFNVVYNLYDRAKSCVRVDMINQNYLIVILV